MKSFNLGGLHYRLEKIKCGRRSCRCCPHGPYWYAYDYRRVFCKKMYIGKKLPPNVQAAVDAGNVTLQKQRSWK